jgi:hypothetical protein
MSTLVDSSGLLSRGPQSPLAGQIVPLSIDVPRWSLCVIPGLLDTYNYGSYAGDEEECNGEQRMEKGRPIRSLRLPED